MYWIKYSIRKKIGCQFSRSPIRFYFQIVCFEDDSRRLRFNFLAAHQCERVRREESANTHTNALAKTHTYSQTHAHTHSYTRKHTHTHTHTHKWEESVYKKLIWKLLLRPPSPQNIYTHKKRERKQVDVNIHKEIEN